MKLWHTIVLNVIGFAFGAVSLFSIVTLVRAHIFHVVPWVGVGLAATICLMCCVPEVGNRIYCMGRGAWDRRQTTRRAEDKP